MLLLGFGIPIAFSQTACVKIIVVDRSDNSTITDPNIDINDQDAISHGGCYTINSGDIIDIAKFLHKPVKLKIQYIDPALKQLVFYLSGSLSHYNSCYTSTSYGLELSGAFRKLTATSTGFTIYNNNRTFNTFPDNGYSMCLENNQVTYTMGTQNILSLLLIKPDDSDTKVDVLIDDDCMGTKTTPPPSPVAPTETPK